MKALALSTVYGYSRAIETHGGDFRYAFPQYASRGGANRPRAPAIVQEALGEVLRKIDANPASRIRYSDIEKQLQSKLLSLVPPGEVLSITPGRSSIERSAKAHFGAYEICKRNHGKREADKRYRTSRPRDSATVVLEVIEIDDKDSGVFLIDELTGLPYGRGFVTTAIDQYSKVPLALVIGDEHRSTVSAMEAIRLTLIPKEKNSIGMADVTSDVSDFYGRPGLIIMDNALYNHSRDLENAILEATAGVMCWAKPYHPTEKSVVEDFNKMMAVEHFANLPGYRGDKADRDGLADGLAQAVMTIRDFSAQMNKWAYDAYCNQPRSPGLTPRQLWAQDRLIYPPQPPAEMSRLNCIFAFERKVFLQKSGIVFFRLSYLNERLALLRRRMGEKAEIRVRFHPHRLHEVFAFDPFQRSFFMVPSTSPEYTTGLTLKQHSLVQKMNRQKGATNPSIPSLLQAKEELRLMVAQLRFSNKRRERKLAMKIGELTPASGDAPLQTNSQISELEYSMDELDKVQLVAPEQWDLPEGFF